jgi:Tfp pilus assembly PilM family ATPase
MFKRKLRSNLNADGPLPAISVLRKRKSVVALDIDGDVLRVVHAAGSRVTRIDSGLIELAAEKREQPAVLGAALKKALESARVKVKEAVIALPRGQVVLRPLQVPMVADVRELASVINFQIAKELPFRIEDAAVDFKVLRAVDLPPSGENPEPQKRLEVLVGAVRSDVVQFYREVAAAAGFKLAGLGLRSVAAAHYATRCAGTERPFLLVSARADEVTLEIVSEGKLVFSRAAIVDRENLLKSLQIEVVRSLHSFEGTGGTQPIQRVLVTGGTGSEGQIAATLAESLKLPAQVLEPSVDVEVKDLDRAEAANAIAAIGLALSALEPSGLLIDFANPKKPAPPRNPKRTQTLLLAAASVALLMTVFGVRAHLIKKRDEIKAKAQAELADAEKKLPIYRRLKAQARLVNGWMVEEQNWLDHLAYLSAVLPPADQIYVSGFTTTPQHVMRFAVNAKTGELLAELDKKLRAAGYELKPLSITPANDKNGYNFRTTVELTIPKRMKPDITKAKPAARPADDTPPKRAAASPQQSRRASS